MNWSTDHFTGYDILEFDVYKMIVANELDRVAVHKVTDEGEVPYAMLHCGIWYECSSSYDPIKPMGIYARLFQQKLDTWHEYDAARNQDESQTWESEMIVHRGTINVIAKGKLILMTTTMLDPEDDEKSITTIVGMTHDEVNQLMQLLTQAKLKQLEWQLKYEA